MHIDIILERSTGDVAQYGSDDDIFSAGTGIKTKAYKILVREILRKYPYGRPKKKINKVQSATEPLQDVNTSLSRLEGRS
jgi:hypothetical protein